MGRDHHPPRKLGSDRRTMVTPDEMQAEIEARGDPGAGQDHAFVDVEHVGIDVGRGEAAGQLAGGVPMRRRAAAVEQAGLAEHERTGADRHDARAPPVRPSQRSRGAAHIGGRGEIVDARHDNRVGVQ
jgi:hypothetical protein